MLYTPFMIVFDFVINSFHNVQSVVNYQVLCTLNHKVTFHYSLQQYSMTLLLCHMCFGRYFYVHWNNPTLYDVCTVLFTLAKREGGKGQEGEQERVIADIKQTVKHKISEICTISTTIATTMHGANKFSSNCHKTHLHSSTSKDNYLHHKQLSIPLLCHPPVPYLNCITMLVSLIKHQLLLLLPHSRVVALLLHCLISTLPHHKYHCIALHWLSCPVSPCIASLCLSLHLSSCISHMIHCITYLLHYPLDNTCHAPHSAYLHSLTPWHTSPWHKQIEAANFFKVIVDGYN